MTRALLRIFLPVENKQSICISYLFPCHYALKCFECLRANSFLAEIDACELIRWHLHETGTLKWFRPVKSINGIPASADADAGLGLDESYCRISCYCSCCWEVSRVFRQAALNKCFLFSSLLSSGPRSHPSFMHSLAASLCVKLNDWFFLFHDVRLCEFCVWKSGFWRPGKKTCLPGKLF